MELQIADKVYFVAGASRGLGYAIAEELICNGASVAIASRDRAAVQAAAEKLNTCGQGLARGYTMDASSEPSIAAAIAMAAADFGRLDGLLVNAGGPPAGQFDVFSDED